jgi:hypothetical protein
LQKAGPACLMVGKKDAQDAKVDELLQGHEA